MEIQKSCVLELFLASLLSISSSQAGQGILQKISDLLWDKGRSQKFFMASAQHRKTRESQGSIFRFFTDFGESSCFSDSPRVRIPVSMACLVKRRGIGMRGRKARESRTCASELTSLWGRDSQPS